MSKTTWILFALAGVFYLLAWTEVAAGLAIFGVFFELIMYVSMYFDGEKKSRE